MPRIVDCHVHLGYGDGAVQASVEELLRSMDEAQVDVSLVYAGALNGCSTERLIKEISAHRGRLVGIGSVSPDASDRPEISQVRDWFASGLIAGLKFYPGYPGEHFYVYGIDARPYMELCSEMGKPVVIHAGDHFDPVGKGSLLRFSHPLTVDDLAVNHPDLKIVIAHMGWPYVREVGHLCRKNANVYTDLSGFVYGEFTNADEDDLLQEVSTLFRYAGGSEKAIFGTDWPIADQRSYVKAVRHMATVKRVSFDALCRRNVERLFGLV